MEEQVACSFGFYECMQEGNYIKEFKPKCGCAIRGDRFHKFWYSTFYALANIIFTNFFRWQLFMAPIIIQCMYCLQFGMQHVKVIVIDESLPLSFRLRLQFYRFIAEWFSKSKSMQTDWESLKLSFRFFTLLFSSLGIVFHRSQGE